MKLGKYYIALMLMLSACLGEIWPIDPEFLPYYESFIEEGKKRGFKLEDIPVSIQFKDIPTDGVSIMNAVFIDPDFWNSKSETKIIFNTVKKEVIIYHELGHALLNRLHNQNCQSLMIKGNMCKYYNFYMYRDDMINEMFYNAKLFE